MPGSMFPIFIQYDQTLHKQTLLVEVRGRINANQLRSWNASTHTNEEIHARDLAHARTRMHTGTHVYRRKRSRRRHACTYASTCKTYTRTHVHAKDMNIFSQPKTNTQTFNHFITLLLVVEALQYVEFGMLGRPREVLERRHAVAEAESRIVAEAGEELIEDVEVALADLLMYETRLLEKIGLEAGANDSP